VRPSDILGLTNDWAAYCADSAVRYGAAIIDKRIVRDKKTGKPKNLDRVLNGEQYTFLDWMADMENRGLRFHR
jgi:hypothetical protein